ncbi:lantibiotic dehydratase, partial [candidate division KSB1 bacterium]|nr:lantibiotic dehydratase [candidate division KSB1 bacterium]
MQLFPYVLIRVSGGPFERLERLNLQEACQILGETASIRKKIDHLKNKLSDSLYEIIASQANSEVQNRLVNFKRDIFNLRPISPDNLSAITSHLPEELSQALKVYFKLKDELSDLHAKGESVYEREVQRCRKNFRDLVQEENFQKGLLLSSQSLLQRTQKYLEKDMCSLKKGDFKTEQSLIKYLSRMYTKTSPFSTFTNLAMGKITPGKANKITNGLLDLNRTEEPKILSHIRLNNYLYQYLKGLLTKIPEVYRYFLLRPNPTLRQEDGHYVFLTNSNNIESFQRLPANPALEPFRILTTEKKVGLVYQKLVQTIINNEYIDAPAADIEAYLNQLIEYGFLEFNIGVSGIDPDWDVKLRNQLKPLAEDVPLIKDLLATLKKVRELSVQYGQSTLARRKQILEDSYAEFRTICMKLHEAAGLPEEERKPREEYLKEQRRKQEAEKEKAAEPENDSDNHSQDGQDEEFKHQSTSFFYFKPEQMFYEDTSLDLTPKLDEKHLQKFVVSLNGLLQEMRHFEGHLDERDKMHHFFSEKYGDNASVNLLTFYEDYYREFKKPEAEKLEKVQKENQQKGENSDAEKSNERNVKEDKKEKNERKDDPELVTLPTLKTRQEENTAWLEEFAAIMESDAIENGQLINIDQGWIEKTNGKFSKNGIYQPNASSYGVFVQFFTEKQPDGEEKLMGVVNATLPGFGKMVSRFLHIFNEDVTDEIRNWNQSVVGNDTLMVEDCDASYFNANLHPPLMPYEIWMPNGHNSLPAEKQIPVTDLQVKIDEKEDRLKMFALPSKRQTFVFDLGFQGQMGRSKLFQLLEKFTLAEFLSYQSLTKTINNTFQESKNSKKRTIMIHPRIAYQNQIILQRKTWYIPKELLPGKKADESDWGYFARINEWRRSQGMPDEVFTFVNPRGQQENIGSESFKKVTRDDYKPQYICFKNPFLVSLFEKLLHKVPVNLKIEEMLPNSQQLLEIGKHRRITEF